MEAELPMSEISKYKITWPEFNLLCQGLQNAIDKSNKRYTNVFGIPKNGRYIISKLLLPIIDSEEEITRDTLIVDDLIDSGTTLSRFPDNDKAVLIVKNNKEKEVNYFVEKLNDWIQFPWEKENETEDLIIRQLEYIGENPNREGLKETPKRVIKSWNELFSGYKTDLKSIFKTFEDGACNEMVILKNIQFYSTCEHHLLPFFGKISIGYVPDKKVIGVSKLARLVEIFSRRLQIQEKLVGQIADALNDNLLPKGVMVIGEAQHFCMTARGIQKQDSLMITSAIRGAFEKSEVRNEFLTLVKE